MNDKVTGQKTVKFQYLGVESIWLFNVFSVDIPKKGIFQWKYQKKMFLKIDKGGS